MKIYSLEKPFFQDKKMFAVASNLSYEGNSNRVNLVSICIKGPTHIFAVSFEEHKSNFISKLLCYEPVGNFYLEY